MASWCKGGVVAIRSTAQSPRRTETLGANRHMERRVTFLDRQLFFSSIIYTRHNFLNFCFIIFFWDPPSTLQLVPGSSVSTILTSGYMRRAELRD